MAFILSVVFAVVTSMIANGLWEGSPRVARRVVRWAAYRQYRGLDYAAEMAEELTHYIEDRPGKVWKLFVALGFAGRAMVTRRRTDPSGSHKLPDPAWRPPALATAFSREMWDLSVWCTPAASDHPRVLAVSAGYQELIRDIHDAAAAAGLDRRSWLSCLRRMHRVSSDRRWRQVTRQVKRLESVVEQCGYNEYPPAGALYCSQESAYVPTPAAVDTLLADIAQTRTTIWRLL